MLVVLDNAEQVADVVARVAQALVAAPGAVRCSSRPGATPRRGRAGLSSGRTSRMPRSTRTSTPETALRYGALALFVDRLRAADRHFRARSASRCPRRRDLPAARQHGARDRARGCARPAPRPVGGRATSRRTTKLSLGARAAPTRRRPCSRRWTGRTTSFRASSRSPSGRSACRGRIALDLARQVLDQPGVDRGNVDLLGDASTARSSR